MNTRLKLRLVALFAVSALLGYLGALTGAAQLLQERKVVSSDEKIALLTQEISTLMETINSEQSRATMDRDALRPFATPKQIENSRLFGEKLYSSQTFIEECERWKKALGQRRNSIREESRLLTRMLGLHNDNE